jgi:DNA-binding transcriptional ArsR family regulator
VAPVILSHPGDQHPHSASVRHESARLFGILAEASRLKLLRALMEKPLTVTELMEATGMKQGNVSKHLSVLLNARFVAREREVISCAMLSPARNSIASAS